MKDKNGQPIVPLPPKVLTIEKLDFTNQEREIYTRLYQNARSTLLGYQKAGTISKNYVAMQVIFFFGQNSC